MTGGRYGAEDARKLFEALCKTHARGSMRLQYLSYFTTRKSVLSTLAFVLIPRLLSDTQYIGSVET